MRNRWQMVVMTVAAVLGAAVLSMGQVSTPARIQILDEGVSQGNVRSVDFTGAGVTASVSGSAGTVNISGGGGGGHTIQDEGSNLTARTGLNFVGAGVTCTDDAGNDQTDCTIPGDLNHNLLSATHTDTSAAAVVRGDLIIGNSTPAWSRLALGGRYATIINYDGLQPSYVPIRFLIGFVSATFQTSSTSYVDVTGMTETFPANMLLDFECYGTFTSDATTTGIGLSINGTGGTGQAAEYTLWWQTTATNTSGNNTGSTTPFTIRNENTFDSMTATTSVVSVANSLRWMMKGFYYTGTSGDSTFALRVRSEVASPAFVRVQVGSSCSATRQNNNG